MLQVGAQKTSLIKRLRGFFIIHEKTLNFHERNLEEIRADWWMLFVIHEKTLNLHERNLVKDSSRLVDAFYYPRKDTKPSRKKFRGDSSRLVDAIDLWMLISQMSCQNNLSQSSPSLFR